MIDKKLQDLVWSLLPKEFKEEVKKDYKFITDSPQWDEAYNCALEETFGIHNLTSDAEGEEMLTVSAITVREMYAANERIKTDTPDKELGRISDHINHILRCLFGSKCLPDGASKLQASCRQVKEPNGTIVGIIDDTKGPDYSNATKIGIDCNDDSAHHIADAGKMVPDRLHIAAMAMQGILSNIDLFKNVLETGMETLGGDGVSFRAVAKSSFLFADALINDAEKGETK